MSYAIICEARFGEESGISHLALVDRAKTRASWWTQRDTNQILKIFNLSKAKQILSRLRMNNPQIVPYKDAVSIIHGQEDELDMQEILSDSETGWDAHKDAF
jgi:hypothetical protein